MDSSNTGTLSMDDLTFAQKVILGAVMSVCATGIILLTGYMLSLLFTVCRHRRRLSHIRELTSMQQQYVGDDVSVAHCGLDPDVLESLPVFVYSMATSHGHRPDCSVCLGEFREGEKGRVLPSCRHSFHKECIDMWLQSHSTCPLCRRVMSSKSREASLARDAC